jgi:hypothetical protein
VAVADSENHRVQIFGRAAPGIAPGSWRPYLWGLGPGEPSPWTAQYQARIIFILGWTHTPAVKECDPFAAPAREGA